MSEIEWRAKYAMEMSRLLIADGWDDAKAKSFAEESARNYGGNPKNLDVDPVDFANEEVEEMRTT
jgi:hypothetical protein